MKAKKIDAMTFTKSHQTKRTVAKMIPQKRPKNLRKGPKRNPERRQKLSHRKNLGVPKNATSGLRMAVIDRRHPEVTLS